MKVNLLKFTERYWIVVPGGNTVQQLIDVILKIGVEEFKNLNMEYIINDKEGQPDVLKASEIIYRYTKPEEITFELYEML
jgi:hypothetical protein